MNDGREEWFERFYGRDFADLTYTASWDACRYAGFLRSVLSTTPAGPGTEKLKILDQCCGNGSVSAAMAVELRSRVLGIDLSSRSIDMAKKMHAGVDGLSFEVADARVFRKDSEFDAVTCWHNSCSYSEDDAVNAMQFECMGKSLKDGGMLIIDSVNPSFIEKHFIERRNHVLGDGSAVETRYRLSGKVLSSVWELKTKRGDVETFDGMSKLYDYGEYRAMLEEVGIEVVAVYGSLERDIISDDVGGMILVGVKKNK